MASKWRTDVYANHPNYAFIVDKPKLNGNAIRIDQIECAGWQRQSFLCVWRMSHRNNQSLTLIMSLSQKPFFLLFKFYLKATGVCFNGSYARLIESFVNSHSNIRSTKWFNYRVSFWYTDHKLLWEIDKGMNFKTLGDSNGVELSNYL